jgi:hypothetical protein
MQYKTIVLLFLREQRPEVHRRLKQKRRLPRYLTAYARFLKTKHEAWKDALSHQVELGRSLDQISMEALELAIEDMDSALRMEFPPEGSEDEALSLDEAMAFIRRHRQLA